MKKILENDKVYYIITIIMIIVLVAIMLTGGIQVQISIHDETVVNSGGPLEPSDTGSVIHSTTSLLIVNVIILAITIVFSIYAYVIDNQNKFKLKIVVVFLILAFLIPILTENNYENQITIAGEREDMRTDYGANTKNLIEKIFNMD